MNNVLFECSVDFTHGPYHFNRRGQTAVVPEHLAKEWQASRLGTIKAKPRMMNKMLPDSLGNVDGPDAQLSQSRPDHRSQTQTSNQSGSGNKLTLRGTK